MRANLPDPPSRLREVPHHAGARVLPLSPTPLIGREREVAELLRLIRLPDCRLLTLTGPGGVGKTRLALAVADEAEHELADGCRLISLAPLTDPLQVVPALARAFHVRELRGRSLPDGIKAALRDKELLLVIDNFEHVAPAGPLLTGILASAPRITILVTSRVVLHVRGEHEFPVEPLELPIQAGNDASWQGTAVELFVQRAHECRPGLELSPETLADIAEICARLDGLPLAIELAAARVKVLPPRAMRSRLDHRLPLLAGGPRDLPERQQTMHDAIRWNHDFLEPDAQVLFRRLAVFAGGATLDAITAVCDVDGLFGLESLECLLDHHLARHVPSDDDPRFGMLETIREFGLERLSESGEEAQIRGAHSGYFCDLAVQADTQMPGPERGYWSHRLEQELPNLRIGLTWLIEQGEAGRALTMVAALGRFWETNAYLREGQEWTERALALGGSTELAAAGHALASGAFLAYRLGEYDRAWSEAEQAREIGQTHNHLETIGVAGVTLGGIAYDRGDYDRATELFAESLAVYRETGDRSAIPTLLNNLGVVAREREDYKAAREVYHEALDVARESGDPRALAFALNGLGVVSQRTGALAEAVAFHEEALALRRESDHRSVPISLSNLGATVCLQNDFDRSAELYRESLQLRWDRGEQFGIAESIAGLLRIAAALNQHEVAVRLFGSVEALREAIGASTSSPDHRWCQQVVGDIATRIGQSKFDELYAEGRALPVDEAIAEAMSVAAKPESQLTAAHTDVGGYANLFSKREIEVLRLLADGQSDKEIGERLYISHRTAMKHVARIMTKCGAQSRTAAVAFAIRHNLL